MGSAFGREAEMQSKGFFSVLEELPKLCNVCSFPVSHSTHCIGVNHREKAQCGMLYRDTKRVNFPLRQ